MLVAELPSTGADPSAPGGLDDDVAEVRRCVAATDGPVVLVGHSYGGPVITDGAAVRVTDDVDRAVEVLCADLDPARRAGWYGTSCTPPLRSWAPRRPPPAVAPR